MSTYTYVCYEGGPRVDMRRRVVGEVTRYNNWSVQTVKVILIHVFYGITDNNIKYGYNSGD